MWEFVAITEVDRTVVYIIGVEMGEVDLNLFVVVVIAMLVLIEVVVLPVVS